MSWLSQAIHAIEGGSGSTPTPLKFGATPGNFGAPPIPMATSPATANFTDAQKSQLQNGLSASGVWDTIQGLGSDVWGTVAKLLPKDAQGNVDWGKIGGNVAGWLNDNKTFITGVIGALEQSARQTKGDKLGQQAVDDAKAQYATQKPLRDAGMAGMLNPSANTPDLTRLGTMATAGQGLQAPQPIPLGQNRANVTATAGVGNPFAPKPIPMAGGPTPPSAPPSAPPTAQPPAIPMAPPSPYVPSKFGAQPIPMATPINPVPGAPVVPPLTPQLPKVGGPVPPRLTIPLGAQ